MGPSRARPRFQVDSSVTDEEMPANLLKASAQGALERLGMLIARNRRSRITTRLARLCHRYLAWYGNFNYEFTSNGEEFVLEVLARFDPHVIFDVGANIGNWTLVARRHCPTARLFCFEIAPPTFGTLEANVANLNDVHCENVGLSDTEDTIAIRHYHAAPALTTAMAYPHPLSFEELPGRVVRGDAYAAAQGIEHIDLLKIDVEGMEDRVLKGFDKMLARGAIDLVQFEYGRANILSHFLLTDFCAFFRQRGYVVGKVFPNFVDFRPYDFADEDFLGPNYLACREDRRDYLRALRLDAP